MTATDEQITAMTRAFNSASDRITTLYSLSGSFNHILDLLEAAEDPEGTADLELELDRIAGSITHKAKSIAGLVAHLEGLAIVRNRLRTGTTLVTTRRKRTAADWMESELYLGGPYPPLTAWEAHRASLLVLVVLAVSLVAWLVWGGRG